MGSGREGAGKYALPLLVYAFLVLAAELTLGNPAFEFYLWRFDAVPAAAWSIPIHLVGFIWIARCANRFSTLAGASGWSLVYFAEGELLNFLLFGIFSYRELYGSQVPAFLGVILLYAVLCAIAVALLHRGTRDAAPLPT